MSVEPAPACPAGMIELPRNPLDFKIDALSGAAYEMLKKFVTSHAHYGQHEDWMPELVAAGFVLHTGGAIVDGVQQEWQLSRTLDGWQANERIRCGIYHEHKRLYAARAKRDLEEEAIPGWGQF